MEKKGLSSIVTTIIIIGVGLVAVGVVWYVINNVIIEQTEDITYSNKCLKVNLMVTHANCSVDSTACDVLVKRSAGGETFDGLNMIFYKADGTSETNISIGNIDPLATVRKQASGLDGNSNSKVEVYAYFTKEDETTHLCSQASSVDIS